MKKGGDLCIVMDIDGVIYRSGTMCTGAKEAVKMIQEKGIQHFFMTNDGGYSEKKKALQLANLLDADVKEEQTVVSHTPFKGLAKKYGKKKILVISHYADLAKEAMKNYGYSNFEYMDEYVERRPYLVHPIFSKKDKEYVPLEECLKEEPFEAIFVLHEPLQWGNCLQVVSDILVGNGNVGIENESGEYNIPIFIGNGDFEYSGQFSLPRMTMGALTICIKALFKRKTGKELKNITVFGKPNETTYQYLLKNIKTKNVYMIGDNPRSDICGAIKMNWHSILVLSGMFKGPENDKTFPANKICKNVLEAVQYIFKREGITKQKNEKK